MWIEFILRAGYICVRYLEPLCTALPPVGKQQLQFGWPSFTTAVVFYLCLNTHKVVTRSVTVWFVLQLPHEVLCAKAFLFTSYKSM